VPIVAYTTEPAAPTPAPAATADQNDQETLFEAVNAEPAPQEPAPVQVAAAAPEAPIAAPEPDPDQFGTDLAAVMNGSRPPVTAEYYESLVCGLYQRFLGGDLDAGAALYDVMSHPIPIIDSEGWSRVEFALNAETPDAGATLGMQVFIM